MFEQIAEWILAIPNSIPPLFGADPHHASLIRAMSALLLIALIIYLIAMRPFRSIIARCVKSARTRIARRH